MGLVKIAERQIQEIFELRKKGKTHKEIAILTECSQSTVCEILNGRHVSQKGKEWEQPAEKPKPVRSACMRGDDSEHMTFRTVNTLISELPKLDFRTAAFLSFADLSGMSEIARLLRKAAE